MDKANKVNACKQIYANVHNKSIDDPDLQQFFKIKGWIWNLFKLIEYFMKQWVEDTKKRIKKIEQIFKLIFFFNFLLNLWKKDERSLKLENSKIKSFREKNIKSI